MYIYMCVCVYIHVYIYIHIYIFHLQSQKPVKNLKSNVILKYNKINIVIKNYYKYHNLKQFKKMLSVDFYFIFFI